MNENHREILVTCPGIRLKLKHLKTTGISTDMRKPEWPYSTGEKANRNHHFGKGEDDHNILFDLWGPGAGGG